MTLDESLGAVTGLVFGIATAVAALILGHGALVVGLAFPGGFVTGWAVGAGIVRPVLSHVMLKQDERRKHASLKAGDDSW